MLWVLIQVAAVVAVAAIAWPVIRGALEFVLGWQGQAALALLVFAVVIRAVRKSAQYLFGPL